MPEPLLTLREAKAAGVGAHFESICSVTDIASKPTRTGGTYQEVSLADASDEVKFKVWSDSPIRAAAANLKPGTIVRVGGSVGEYNGRADLKAETLVPLTDAERSDPALMGKLTPVSLQDPKVMERELTALIAAIPHAGIRSTVESILNDQGDRFRESVAALGMHHAYRHGLLEHTLRMAKVAAALLPLYPKVDASLALAGVILHDVGKVQEYTRLEPGMAKASFTRAGNLHGHLVLGAFMVREHATKVGLEVSLRERLEHVILSHHTLREFGACQTPSTPEAVFVARIDDLDAKLSAIEEELRRATSGQEFVQLRAIDGHLMTTPPKTGG
jgi:3'-5' exoribonuclease